MAEEISMKLTVDAVEGATSVKQLKQLLKDAKDAALQFGEGTAEFANFSQVAAIAKDKIKDINKTLDTLDPSGRGHAFQQMGGTMLGAFSAAQGAMALFGGESENLQKSLLKVQAAMALAQGFQQMQDGAKAFGAMKIMVANVVTELGVMKAALIATGIGALAVLVGLVAANWDKVTAAMFPVNAQLEKQVELSKQSYDNIHNENKLIEIKAKMMKLNGENEGAIASWREKQYTKELKAIEVQIKAEAVRLAYLESQNKLIIASSDAVVQLAYNIWSKSNTDAIDKSKKALDELKDSYVGLSSNIVDTKLQLKDFNDKQSESNKQIDETVTKVEDLKNAANEYTGALSEQRNVVVDNTEEVIVQLSRTEQPVNDLNEVNAVGAADGEKQHAKKMDNAKAEIETAKMTFSAISNITELFGNKNKAAAKKAFEINKQASAGQALISTYEAATKAFASAPNPIIGAIEAGIVVVSGLANVAKIESQKFEGGGSSGGSATSGGGSDIGSFSPGNAINQTQPQTNLTSNQNNGQAVPIIIQNNISEHEIRSVQQRNDMYASLATIH